MTLRTLTLFDGDVGGGVDGALLADTDGGVAVSKTTGKQYQMVFMAAAAGGNIGEVDGDVGAVEEDEDDDDDEEDDDGDDDGDDPMTGIQFRYEEQEFFGADDSPLTTLLGD